MSQPVHIPARRGATSCSSSSSTSLPASAPSSYTGSSASISTSLSSSSSSSNRKEAKRPDVRDRRGSLMSSALAASEHTVINVGHPDGPPRLITCVRSSQGFDWNQEIFLPSHYDHLAPSPDLERKKDPVHDIVLTDEEARGVFPQ